MRGRSKQRAEGAGKKRKRSTASAPRRRQKRRRLTSGAHLGVFGVGQISALHDAGYSAREMADDGLVTKADGTTATFGAIGRVVRRLRKEPLWRGERRPGTGPKRKTTLAEDKKLVQAVLRRRGKEKMTSGKVRRRTKIRKITARTVRRRLAEARLKWLRRRRKHFVPEESRKARLRWARRVLKQPPSFLRRWVYTDGVSFYLDRCAAEQGDKKRLALGPFVWRTTEQRDALFADCVGPSSYAKAQGELVRVWGLLVNGRLHISVLEHGKSMNRWEYSSLIQHKMQGWLRGVRQPLLVQDYEKCLWCEEPQAALRDIGVRVLRRHPKHSPDLNAIENAWAYLRERLAETHPDGHEDRDDFVRRLRNAVAWINVHKRVALRKLCRNQKERARDVQLQEGHKTQW